MASSRFARTSEIEAEEIRRNRFSKSTLKSNKKAANLLKSYLREQGRSTDFEELSSSDLNKILRSFYLDARKCDGSLYKTGSLQNFRHSLNRYLNAVPYERNIDLIKDDDFREANISYIAMLAQLKREGKGETTHYPSICSADLQKLYNSMSLNVDTPTGLFNTVQFNIRLYFFRRGAENIHKMLKSSFEIRTNPDNGERYVAKTTDELTKNHRGSDKEGSGGGQMPEIKGNRFCPVASFQKYISKLNPLCEKLWQRPRDSFCTEDYSWYCNVPVGEKTLQKFMPELSGKCQLSTKYSNHSIRATGATILSKLKFNPAQIMSVTGHRSVSSLAVYQKVSESEKFEMGSSLGQYVHGGTQNIPKTQAIAHSSFDDVVLDEWDFNIDTVQPSTEQVNTNILRDQVSGRIPGQNLLQNLPNGLFNNCQINNLHIHISK